MYKNLTKDIARKNIWTHTINTLTVDKNYSTVITEKELYLYWEYLEHTLKKDKRLNLSSQENIIKQFLDYRKSSLGNSTVEKLKILFFCGPEPENDIEVLLGLGILEENIWAIELDKLNFTSALNIIKHSYPGVKIFKTKIDHIFDVIKIKFDIVYLDYTAPFFSKDQKPYKTTIELFKNNILSDFGVLITNYSEIKPADDNFENYTKIIKEYFNYQTFVHELSEEEGTYLTSPYIEEENFLDIVKSKYKNAYSSFLTHFHLYLAEIITPSFNVFKNKNIQSIFFDDKILKEYLKKVETLDFSDDDDFIKYGDKLMEPESFWFEHFIENIKDLSPNIYGYFKTNKIDSLIQLTNLLKNWYSDKEIFNKETLKYLEEAQSNLIDPRGGLFCDVPMLHLWVNLLINQLGAPYHLNLKKHKRFRYTGNEREMFVDIYTLDKCRYFYDWLPSLSSLPENMLDIAKQLLIRINIDIIRKTTQNYLIDESYQYGNLLCYNDDGVHFLEQLYLEERKVIKSDPYTTDKFIEMFETADFLAQKVADNYFKSFASFIQFHMTYTAHAFVSLKIKKIPEDFKVFGKKFKKYDIENKYNFRYYSNGKHLYYRTKYVLNGSHRFDLMIIKTIKSVFDRYGFDCEIIDRPD
ncbi:hypothetical protein EC396_12020 [Lutibacter sp. HS1-25]|uniref:hypothetical protein n=1 Tax=Lutibacter sp. HS1-25 TaxID=2485000 RepID=UPI0010139871|nr:hypothetical protein [Lutibacter sp. HS1-25]RXP51961.1 hypothetical protein EC396_12020 [Lutibacter sp. HS1-25]